MMKHIPGLICLLYSLGFNAQDCKVENKSFQYGERIDYTIFYHLAGVWVSAGNVYFEVDSTNLKGNAYYHFKSYGKTLEKYDWMYKVRDSYEAYVSEKGMQPLRFKREVNEGTVHINEDYVFNYSRKQAITLRQMEEDEAFVKDTVPFEGCSYDVMSMIYIARNMDYSEMKVNDKIPIELFLDNKSHKSYIKYLGKENVKIKGLGEFRCIVFEPLLIEGTIFSSGDGMKVYVTDDENRVPVLIETPILVGSIRARVSGMKGLLYPLESKINEE